MSVIIRAYSNHGLEINDYLNGISNVEEKLNIRIENRSKSDLTQTDEEEKIIHFTNHEYFLKRFDDGWPIWIYSNFRICDQIRVYKHFIDFSLSGEYNLKTHIWRNLISGKTAKEYKDSEREIKETMNEWNRTRQYIHSITKKLLGDTVIYLNDGSSGHVRGEEAIWGGVELSIVIKELTHICDGTEYVDLEKGTKEYGDANWFIEKL